MVLYKYDVFFHSSCISFEGNSSLEIEIIKENIRIPFNIPIPTPNILCFNFTSIYFSIKAPMILKI